MKISVTCLKPITIDHNKRQVALELNILGKGQVSTPLRLQLEDLDDREMSTTSESGAGTKVVIINATEGEHENT